MLVRSRRRPSWSGASWGFGVLAGRLGRSLALERARVGAETEAANSGSRRVEMAGNELAAGSSSTGSGGRPLRAIGSGSMA